MPQSQGLKNTLPRVLLDLFQTAMGDVFKGYYEGDPIIIPQSMLPAIIVSEPSTDYQDGPTGHDEIVHEILVQVVFNKKDEFGKSDKEATLEGTIDSIMQGRDATTGDFKDSSVMGVLRRNITLGNISVQTSGKVQKYVFPRSETLITTEAQVTVSATELQAIANRT